VPRERAGPPPPPQLVLSSVYVLVLLMAGLLLSLLPPVRMRISPPFTRASRRKPSRGLYPSFWWPGRDSVLLLWDGGALANTPPEVPAPCSPRPGLLLFCRRGASVSLLFFSPSRSKRGKSSLAPPFSCRFDRACAIEDFPLQTTIPASFFPLFSCDVRRHKLFRFPPFSCYPRQKINPPSKRRVLPFPRIIAFQAFVSPLWSKGS